MEHAPVSHRLSVVLARFSLPLRVIFVVAVVPFLFGGPSCDTPGFLRRVLHVQLLLRAPPIEEPMGVHLRTPGHRRPCHHRAYFRRDGHWGPGELAHRLRALLPPAHAVQGELTIRRRVDEGRRVLNEWTFLAMGKKMYYCWGP